MADRSEISNDWISGKINANMWNVLNFDGSPENRIYGCLKAIINITPL
jgi:hypothetical protein